MAYPYFHRYQFVVSLKSSYKQGATSGTEGEGFLNKTGLKGPQEQAFYPLFFVSSILGHTNVLYFSTSTNTWFISLGKCGEM